MRNYFNFEKENSYQLSVAVEFVNYTNMDDIRDIATHKDTVWIASSGGAAKLDINGNVLARYTYIVTISHPR